MARTFGFLLVVCGLLWILVTEVSAKGQEPGPWIWADDSVMSAHDCLARPDPCNSLFHDCAWRDPGVQCFYCRMDDPTVERWCIRRDQHQCDVTSVNPVSCGLLTEGICTSAVVRACGAPYKFHNNTTCLRWPCQGDGS